MIKHINLTFNKEISQIIDLFQKIKKLDKKSYSNFVNLCKESVKALKNGKKIIFFGNGGSAADSQHLAAELVVKYKKKRKALAAIALTTDTSILTSIGNDYDFTKIFSRQIESIGNAGDIAIAITTSGNSKNLIQAVKIANKKKIITFCFSGNEGGYLKKHCKFCIIIPSNITSLIQVAEITLGQIFCEIVEQKFNEKN
jgi:D-sedoheptulose 7-phosphate isomerase